MKLLVNGASFSYGPGSWPELLGNNLTNLSQWNAGNTYILETTIEEVAAQEYDWVIVMWSPFDRMDVRVSDTEWEFDVNSDLTQWQHYVSNLMKIISLQEFLKQRKQSYLFTFARPLKMFNKYEQLYNQVDWQNVYPLALQPVMKQHGWYAEDGVHPGAKAHVYYARELNQYLEKSK
jgi:predicted DNA-binding transcriptional regulator